MDESKTLIVVTICSHYTKW